MTSTRGEPWFHELYTTYRPDVMRYLLRRLPDGNTAVDLCQEVFVVAWRRRRDVPDDGLPWLYGVARRVLANHWRARRAAPPQVSLDAYAAPEHPARRPGADRLDQVRAALDGLPEADREILRLVAWEGLSAAEAATVLGCRRVTASVRLHRARRKLARALGLAVDDHPHLISVQLERRTST